MYTKVFVYGTLRGSVPERAIPSHTKESYRLYDGNHFPALSLKHPDGRVVGELLEVNQDTLDIFDAYESVDIGLYARSEIEVVDNNGKLHMAWVYHIPSVLSPYSIENDIISDNWKIVPPDGSGFINWK